jgi:hypothetical protein
MARPMSALFMFGKFFCSVALTTSKPTCQNFAESSGLYLLRLVLGFG